MTIRKASLFTLLVFIAFRAHAQITPEQYFPIRLIYQLKADTCTILKWNKDNVLSKDLSIIFDRAKMKMTLKDPQNGMLIEFVYNNDTMLVLQNLYSVSPKNEKKLVSQDSFFYNTKKQKSRYKSVNFLRPNEPSIEATYLYRNDTLITEVYTYGAEIFRTIVYAFNNKTRVKHQTILSAKATENYYFVYNSQHQLQSDYATGINSTDTLFEHRYLYDAQGRLTETQVFDNQGALQHIYRNSYLDNGLTDVKESYLLIKNNDLGTALYQKKVYRYGFRKTK
jgi:YD repeat-containing protein